MDNFIFFKNLLTNENRSSNETADLESSEILNYK